MSKWADWITGRPSAPEETPPPEPADPKVDAERQPELEEQLDRELQDGDTPVPAPAPAPVSTATLLPAAILAIASAVIVLIGQLTPMYESVEFFRIAKNTILQNGAGWGFVAGCGIIVMCALFGRSNPIGAAWGVLIVGVLIVGGAAFLTFSEEARTLTALAPPLGETGEAPREEVAAAGIGLYLTAIGGFGAIAAAVAALWPQLAENDETVRRHLRQHDAPTSL